MTDAPEEDDDTVPPPRTPFVFPGDEDEEHVPDPGMPQYHRGRVFLAGFTIFLLLIILIAMFSCGPRKGTMLYGICKTYLEQAIAYPETIVPVNVEQYPSATRIYYTSIDAFGQYKIESIECVFAIDQNENLIVQKALLNRREEPQEKVELFNKSIPAVIAGKPDLTLPERMPDINEILKNIK